MTTPKDTDIREALRRKYANVPQMRTPLQLPRGEEKKRFPWHQWLYPISAVAAILVIAFILRPGNSKVETPVVAEVVEQPAPEAPKASDYSEVSENSEKSEPSEPVKPKRTHKVRKVQEEPQLAEAETMPEEVETEQKSEYRPTDPDPMLLAAAFAKDVRSRGERLHQEVAQSIKNP
jgi:hypothetical protein